MGSIVNSKDDVAGGAETQLLNFVGQLSRQGQKVSIISNFRNIGKNSFIRKKIQCFSCPFKYLGGSNFHIIFDWFTLVRLILKIKPDVIILKHPRHLIFLLSIISNLSKKQFFFYAAIDKDVDTKLIKNEPFLAQVLYKVGLKLVSGIFAQTIHQQEAFKKLTKVKVFHLPNIYSHLPLEDRKNPFKNSFILWVGSNSSRKRPHIFRDIAIQHPQLLFVMIYSKGDGTGGIDEKMGPANLIYIPSCPRDKIGKYYYKSLFLVSTSRLEGFPNIFLESWYFKKPVLSLDIDPDGIIARHQLGIVVYNLDILHKKIAILANNEKLRNRLGVNGKAYLESNHSPEKVILKFLKILGI